MKKYLLSFCFGLFIFYGSATNAQQRKLYPASQLHISWRLTGNAYNNTSAALAVFTLINKAGTPFPGSGWTIYFNSSQPLAAAKDNKLATISHVNGDIFKLVPGPAFPALKKNDSLSIAYFTNGTIINSTATPGGLYIVWDKQPEKGFSLTSYTVQPMQQHVPGITGPDKVFYQNSIIQPVQDKELPKILPTPVSYTEEEGHIYIDGRVELSADPVFENERNYLSEELQKRLLVNNADSGTKRRQNRIQLQKEPLPSGEYLLSVNEEGIKITAAGADALFNGIQSLFSLMPPAAWKSPQTTIQLQKVKVADKPRFGYRSLMMDVARNFKSKETVFRILDMMALYKMNVLHFHFSDDEGWRIEIPSLPELTSVGAVRGYSTDATAMLLPSYAAGPEPGKSLGTGYYSKNDFIQILKYATARHIQVIPEIETPGHARAAIKSMDARYEKYMRLGNKEEAERYLLRDRNDQSVYSSAQLWTDNVMCVALPSVYAFLEKVVDELRAMYKEAGATLQTIHMGGDEVPSGVWEKSPVCRQLVENDPALHEINDLWYYYYGKVNKLLQAKGLFLSAWEEAGMRKTIRDGKEVMIANPRMANENIQLHVWNNVTGWGAEDLPYRLANAGYKVVLSPVSNNYLDLAYYKHPEEPGYYWGGFQDIDKPFYFIPFDYYKNSKDDPDGNPVDPAVFIGKDRLTDFGKSNIVGIQGLLWAENLRSPEIMEYLLLPKLLAVAERAWAADPAWATEPDSVKSRELYIQAWSVFLHQVGKRELPRLDYLVGGFSYRIPAPGAVIHEGKVLVNIQFPGLQIRFTTDGTVPTAVSTPVTGPIADKGQISIRAFDSRGRGGRTIIVDNN